MSSNPTSIEIYQHLDPLAIKILPPTGHDIQTAIEQIQLMNKGAMVRELDLRQSTVLLVNGHHHVPSTLHTVIDQDLTVLAQAATAVGYAVWGNQERNPNKCDDAEALSKLLLVHQELVASRHNGDSHLLAYIGLIDRSIQLGGVVTLVQGHEADKSEFEPNQPTISIGFNELLSLPVEVVDELIQLHPSQVGELTLFTVLDHFRDYNLKRIVARALLRAAVIRAKELGVKLMVAIMPEYVSRLLPKESYVVIASTSTVFPQDSVGQLPAIRKLQQNEVGYTNASNVYEGYPKYWQGQTLQLCKFNLE